MDRNELMAEKAILELEWSSIGYLFQPRTLGELLLRTNFEGTCKRFGVWLRSEISVETFYRKLKGLHNGRCD